jgi:hypothetical protein
MASLNPKPDIVLTDRGQQSDNIIRFGRHLLFAHDFAGIVDDAPPSPSPNIKTHKNRHPIAASLLPGPGNPDLLIISGRAALRIFGNAAAAIHHLWRAQGPEADVQPRDGQRQQSTHSGPWVAPGCTSVLAQTETIAGSHKMRMVAGDARFGLYCLRIASAGTSA